MTPSLLIRGLPTSLARDGWWLDAAPPRDPDRRIEFAAARLPPVLGLLLLIVFADLLFWDHYLGVSVAVFAVVLFTVATAGTRPLYALWRPTLVLLIASAPVVDHVQMLSIGFLALGLVFALAWARRPDMPVATLSAFAAALLRCLPARWLSVLNLPRTAQKITALRRQASGPTSRALIRDWAFPIAGTLVFAALVMQANPVLARVLDINFDLWAAVSRALFWIAAAIFIAPFLAPDLPDPITLPTFAALPLARFGLNAASVLRALSLFNLIIGVQTLTDLSILTGGAMLPAGMNFAEYAHRGAYPLLATALLAGAFALAARPFLGEHRAIRPLLLLWIAQNMVLCGAAMLRLEHYIEAFGLTYLRLYALIWMGLVAVGLGLMLWQVIKGRSNLWLLARGVAAGLATLYICSFVNFAQVIAAQNLTRTNVDFSYVCDLGPMAGGALAEAIRTRPDPIHFVVDQLPCDAMRPISVSGWQEWGFRSWQVTRYIDEVETGRPVP